MASILTPRTLWSNFDSSLDVLPVIEKATEEGNVRLERVRFLGRDTGKGRVSVSAAFAYDLQCPSFETVLILPDSKSTVDEELVKLFVSHGYSALMVDYRGEWDGCEYHTHYPDSISYANTAKCGRRKDYVDESADRTSWYEWVSVGIFAHKYIKERTGADDIAVVGIRDGGEIAWKLATICKFSCMIPVCAAGWKAYAGISKYLPDEPAMDRERYRYLAGIDSQAYAPYVKCPVLMLCSTNDMRFDYDRAYDTFSRINPEYAETSSIAYTMHYYACIGSKGTNDMFMFLDKHLRNRQVFIPDTAVVKIETDAQSNLIARVKFDDRGIVESSRVYFAENCVDSAIREWMKCPLKNKVSSYEQEFYLNVYEGAHTVFVICEATYSNGFTVSSKISVSKISGKFRNTQNRCKVLFTQNSNSDVFTVANPEAYAIAGMFFKDTATLPRLVAKTKGVKGLFAPGGVATTLMNNQRFAPHTGNILSFEVFCDKTTDIILNIVDLSSGEKYTATLNAVGKVWQNLIADSKQFKNASGIALSEFITDMRLEILCREDFAINNLMWL